MKTNDPADSLLLRIANYLEAQAEESIRWGWSTHQVAEQRRLAVEIRNAVMTERYEDVLRRVSIAREIFLELNSNLPTDRFLAVQIEGKKPSYDPD